MIFRTITDDITGANKSIGLFGLSLQNVENKLQEIQAVGFKNAIFNSSTIDTSAITAYNNEISKGATAQQALATASRNTNRATIALMESANGATISTEQLAAAQQASTLSSKALSMAIKTVSVAMNMIAFALIAKGIQLAADAIDHYVNRAKYAAEALEEAQQKIDESQNSLKELSDTLEENRNRFLELSEGVDRFSHNLTLSEEEYSEYLSISQKLAELFPSLISGYDDQGNVLLDIGNSAEDTNAKLNELLETQQAIAQQTLIDNMDAVADGIYYEVEEAKNNITGLEAELKSLDDSNVAIDIEKTVNENFGRIAYLDDGSVDNKYYEGMEKALTSAKIKFEKSAFGNEKYFQLLEASPEQLENAQKFYDAMLAQEKEYYSAKKAGLEKDIKEQENKISGFYTKMSANLQAWTKDNYEYQYLSDSMQGAIDAIIPNIDWASMGDNAPKNAYEYQSYILENFINPLMDIPKDSKQKINDMFQELLSFEPGDIDVVSFAKLLENELKKLNIEIDLTPIYSAEESSYNVMQNAMADAAQKASSATDGEISSKSGKYNEYEEIYNTIEDFAEQYEINTIEEAEAFADALEEANGNIEKAFEKYLSRDTASSETLSSTEHLSQVQSLSKGFDQLDEIYADVYDKEYFDWSSILNNEDFKEVFGEFTEEYENFIETVTKNPDDINACQESFNELASAYLYASDVLGDNLTPETKEATTEMLRQMGFTNAETLVTQALERKKRDLSLAEQYETAAKQSESVASRDLTTATSEEINKLIEEGYITSETAEQISLLAFKKQWCNKNTINTSGDIKNLAKLATASATLTRLLNALASAKAAVESGAPVDAYQSTIDSLEKQINDYIDGDFGNFENPVYGGGSATKSAKDKSSSTKEETVNTETYDWIEKKLEAIAKKTEKAGEAFEKAFTLTNTEKSYAEYLSQIDEEISANNTAIQTYQAKLNSIGLSADWIAKIQNGEYSITDVTDDALNERIGLYQEYYDKLESCQGTVEELEKKRLEAQNQYAEKIVEIYDREIEKIDKLIDRRESLIELKEKFGGSASASDLKYEQKKYSQQITIYDKQIDKLKELQKTVAVGSDAWKTYKEQIEANKESVLDITNSIADLAEQLASLPLEKYEKFLEKNDAKNEYYTSKYNNVVSTASKGKLLTNQIDALTAKNDKTQSYATTAKKNFNNSKTSVDKAYNSDMNNKNTTDEEKSVLTEYRNKVKNYTKNNKKIPASLITKIGKDGFGEFHKACINYNEMLEAKDAAVETAKLTAEQTRTEIRELAEQKYNLPIEKYDEGVEKNDKKNALYEAQLSNKTSASSKNKVINKQIELEENNLAKAQNAVKETSKNVTSSISDIKTAKTQESKGKTKTEKSKINKLYTQVSKYTKSKKAIPNDLITKIGKAGLTSLQTACDEYNAALAANQTATDTAKVVAEQTKSNVNELKKQQFDNIQEKYSRKASQTQAKANNVDSRIALLEAKGYQSSASWYNELIAYEKQNLANSQAELKALKAKQNEMTKYTDEWWEAEDAINSVTQAVNDSTLALQEFLNTQREINFENFEFLQGQISRLSEEAQYFIDLMQNKEMTGDNGLTNYGLTAMGLYYQQIETGLNQAQDYAKKIAEIDQELLKEPYDTELLTQKQEYIDAQRDIMTNNESLKKSIADLVKDGYDSLLDSLGEVIDKYKEVLQNAKDAHDYQKNISDKTENINTLQKQITAYASMTGNDEVASKLQSLQAEYKDAQEDLQETLYDKYISDTDEILDEMLDELETFIEELSKNIEELYKIGVEQITNGVGDIYTTLLTLANNANTPMSDEMTIVWEDNSLMTNLTTAIEEATKAIKATIDEQSDASAFEVFSSKYDKTDYDSQIATAKRDWDSARLRISEYGGITDEEPYLDIKNSLEKDNADMQAEIKLLESKIAKTKNKAKIAEFNQRINDLISKIASNNAEIKTNDLELEKVRELNDGLENATIAYINAVNAKTSAMDNNKAVIKELLSAIANDYPTGLSDEQTELDKKVSDILGMTSYLSKANISQLAELFGVRDNEFFVLQALKNAGFATGGIVKAVGEDGIGLVRNGEGFVMPEVVPIMQDILGAMPKIDTFIDTTLSNLPSNRGNIEQTIEFGDIYMSGVNDPQEFSKQLISTFQNEAKVQKMFGTFVNNSLTGKNSLSIRKY